VLRKLRPGEPLPASIAEKVRRAIPAGADLDARLQVVWHYVLADLARYARRPAAAWEGTTEFMLEDRAPRSIRIRVEANGAISLGPA
jgi:hypothetical protein